MCKDLTGAKELKTNDYLRFISQIFYLKHLNELVKKKLPLLIH